MRCWSEDPEDEESRENGGSVCSIGKVLPQPLDRRSLSGLAICGGAKPIYQNGQLRYTTGPHV